MSTATLKPEQVAAAFPRRQSRATIAGTLLLFTCVAFVVHGYHFGIEDGAIYVPAIKKQLHPALYPHDTEMFLSKTRATLFPQLISYSVRLTHIPLEYVDFAWQFIAYFLVLLGCWKIARRCFAEPREQWAAVALVATLFTLPVAGTSLFLVDQHLHPRTLATAALLFAIDAALDKKTFRILAWCAVAFAMNALMAVFGFSYLVFLVFPFERVLPGARRPLPGAAAVLPFVARPTDAWRQAAYTREYYFLRNWAWYEWLGIFAPLVLLWWFARLARNMGSEVMAKMCTRLIAFSIFQFTVAAAIALPRRMEFLAPLEPMRYLHLTYLLMVLFAGGLLAHYILRGRVWRWAVLFVPLCAGLFIAQREEFAASHHIEWPGVAPKNDWVQAFLWIRDNTPADAYFALDPWYVKHPGEEYHGFRALAERSMISDYGNDGPVAIQVPTLAVAWQQQVNARSRWEAFSAQDFRKLKARFGVNWAVVERPPTGLRCPYRNTAVAVCRIE